MFGFDQQIAHLGAGGALGVALLVSLLLGLRHASDPDHLAAVGSLSAAEHGSGAGRLGLAWGAGHATTLLAFGLPVVLWRGYLPEQVRRLAEVVIGLVIIALALRLLLHHHPHRRVRSRWQAFGIGLVHGTGGSAGVSVLLLSTISEQTVAVLAMLLFAAGTAVSMALVSSILGRTIVRIPFGLLRPGMGSLSLLFGAWYVLGAVGAAPYPF
ncbi:MAG: hypothetical protein ACXVZO_01940 [Gaiellaceae bacterium]